MEDSAHKSPLARLILPKSYALRLISGKPQLEDFPLPVEGEIIIGRNRTYAPELDIVLDEDMVNRRHAKIAVTRGQIVLQDLDTVNGTFVNGELSRQARLLREGDRILIGTKLFKLVAIEVGVPVHAMAGSIAETPISDLLQLFCISKKSCMLVIRSDRQTGRIFLDSGRIVYASIDESPHAMPIKCFYRALTWPEGTFNVEPLNERTFENAIDITIEGLLMEGMRQLDELRNIADTLPSQSARLSLAVPLEPKLRDLAPDELDVLQIVLSCSRFVDVLDRSASPDFETSRIVAKLLKMRYIFVST